MRGADFKPDAATVSAQSAAVLVALQEGPKTTAALHALGVLAPAARIMDLRRAGWPIATLKNGRQARYCLGAR